MEAEAKTESRVMRSIFSILLILLIPSLVNAADGVINVESQFSVKTTADRLEKILNEKGMTVFNRIKHSENAAKIGVQLRETELIIFGNPKAGSPLMKCQQTVAIDLPQKALIWRDEKSKVWLSYNDMRHLENRHRIVGCEKVISKVEKIVAKIIGSASKR